MISRSGRLPSVGALAADIVREFFIAAMLLFALINVLAFCTVLWNPLQANFPREVWDFTTTLSVDENGQPLGAQLISSAGKSLELCGWTLVFLCLLGTAAGAGFLRWPGLRMLVLAVSAAPSFLLPFVKYFFVPGEFRGFFADTSLLWPALALAVGDLNLIYVSDLFGETLRHELAQPHVRTLRLITTFPIAHVWPRTGLVLLQALAARTPHLIGGTIALERMYNIHGLGYLTLEALFDETPDYKIVFWVCAVGVGLRLSLRSLYLIGAWLCRAPSAKSAVDQAPAPPAAASDDDEELGLAASAARSAPAASGALAILPSLTPEPVPPPTFAATCWRRFLYYWRYSRWNQVETVFTLAALLATSAGAAWLATIPGPDAQAKVRRLPPNMSPAEWKRALADPQQAQRLLPKLAGEPPPLFGTDSAGNEVECVLAAGLRQTAFPLMLAVALGVGCGGIAGSLFGLRPGVLAGAGARAVHRLGRLAMRGILEFFEGIPKLVILLLIYGSLGWTGFIVKMYAIIGLIFAPQVYRALASDLETLNKSLFLESSETAGVSRKTIWLHNVLRNHSLHVLAVQAAILLGCVIHFDAMLGYVGIRKKNVLYNWGSILGANLDVFNQTVPGEASIRLAAREPLGAIAPALSLNQLDTWLPALGVWWLIFVAFLVAHFIKVPLSGYVYRLK